MNTFMPYNDYVKVGYCLDPKRLRSQANESLVIWKMLTGNTQDWKNPDAWKNHPAVLQWRGHEDNLLYYHESMVAEIRSREGVRYKVVEEFDSKTINNKPEWVFNEEVKIMHRALLLYKEPKWYQRYNWKVEPSPKRVYCVDGETVVYG